MDLWEWIKVLILGIVEGITEWLPISSTGHMILVDEFIKLDVSPEFMNMFLVVIQLGAILAVVVLYWEKIWPFHRRKAPRSGRRKDNGFWATHTDRDKITLWGKIIVSCLPAIVIGLPLNDTLETYFYNYVTVSLMLILYGVLFIVVENRNKRRAVKISSLEELDYKTALLIGVFQVLSLIPGTSRSGSTILGGILLGTSRTVAAEFTFFLAIPVMFGASLLKLVKFGFHFTGTELLILLVGMVTAFVVSILAIKFLMSYIKRNDFKAFGWYRIILGIIVILYFLIFS